MNTTSHARAWTIAAAAVLVLAACTPGNVTPDAHHHHKPTPTPAPTTAPPAPGGLHVVHTPQTLVDDMRLHAGQCHARGGTIATDLPDPACTPGAIDPAVTQANIHTTICVRGWTATVRPPLTLTGPAKRASMADYGITTGAGSVEYDHLVPLELGGAVNDPRNLWPEPDYATRAGFYLNPKDHLERTLNRPVCSGRMSLSRAQLLVAREWASAYRRYG